ncbi:MAG: hypothetical protein DRP60_06675 [Spirochaetes bacterium]|nr:MAG: hypothetical protein DRP60_06675 [Spirochaetota bacterium]
MGLLRYIGTMNSRLFSIITVFIIFICFAVMPLAALSLDIDYLDGTLEYREGQDTWLELGIGDSVPENRTIRLSGRGFAELSAGNKKITLTQDGLYESADLIGTEPDKPGFRQVLGSKFSSLFNRSENGQNTVAAVRGAEAESDDFISWEDDSADYLADGMGLFNEGDYAGAKDLFEEGSLWETGAVQRECTFRLGLSEQALGDPRTARKTLTSIRPESDDPFLEEYTIAMATLYIESMDYQNADDVLSVFLDTGPSGDAAQAAWLLSAYSLEGQGDSAGSRRSLQKAVDQGPNTEIGRAAAEMLNG